MTESNVINLREENVQLEDLARRLDHERDGEHAGDEVVLMTPDGRRYELLSLNWDAERGEWVLVGARS